MINIPGRHLTLNIV